MLESQPEPGPGRPEPRRFVAMIVITSAVALALGVMLRQPTMMGANDISRWCTVWSLLERGTYVIDECPWQIETQDKVYRAPGDAGGGDGARQALLFEQARASADADRRDALPGAAGSRASRSTGSCSRSGRSAGSRSPTRTSRARSRACSRSPRSPVKWPVYVFYFKPVLILLNIIPFAIFLVLFARVLDRYAPNDWAWFFSLIAAAFGTYLLPVHADAEQPHDRGLQRLLRGLPVPPDLGRVGALGLAVRGGGLLRGLHRGQRASRAGLPGRSSRCSSCFDSRGRRSAISFPRPSCRWRHRGGPVRGARRAQACLRRVRHRIVSLRGKPLEDAAGARCAQSPLVRRPGGRSGGGSSANPTASTSST